MDSPGVMELLWMVLPFLWNLIICPGEAVDCYTCSIDFRSEPYVANNSCLFPRDNDGRTTCSRESKYCQGIITRINGVFVQLQRTCEVDCQEFCTEKGFGIETSECRFCCNDSVKNNAACGFQGFKSSAYMTEQILGWFIVYIVLTLTYNYFKSNGNR